MLDQNQSIAKGKSPMIKFLFPGLVVLAVLAAILASQNPKQNPENSSPAIEETQAVRLAEWGLDACSDCHRTQYEDWCGSPHAAAASDEAFLAALKKVHEEQGMEPVRSCLVCHAPLDSEGESLDSDCGIPAGSLAAQGIACAACHLGGGDVLTAQSELIPTSSHDRELWVMRPCDAEMCANCHNPSEPLLGILDPEPGFSIPAGNPYQEWLDSPYSEMGSDFKSCLSCHGKAGTGSGHNWRGGSAENLQAAYTIEVTPFQRGDGMLMGSIRIENTGAGHAFPTGDPGHMITLETWVGTEFGEILTTSSYCLMGDIGGGAEVAAGASDNRLRPGEFAEIILFAPDPGETERLILGYRVTYGWDFLTARILSLLGIEEEPLIVEETEIPLPLS